jgi:WXG100 family type VII secretion target
MAGTTQVNYDDMNNIIKTFKTEEEEIMNLLKTTKSKVESLHNNQWVGQAADNFFNEMEQTVLPALARLARALGVGSDVAQKIVDTIRQADEETQSFFNNLGA